MPQFIEVESYKTRTTILTAGMPYHRRIGKRMLDCLLRMCGESSTKFRLGIGIDAPDAWRGRGNYVAAVRDCRTGAIAGFRANRLVFSR